MADYSPEIQERIKRRAYEIYEYCREEKLYLIQDRLGDIRERTELDNWIEAEKEILTKIKQIKEMVNEWRK